MGREGRGHPPCARMAPVVSSRENRGRPSATSIGRRSGRRLFRIKRSCGGKRSSPRHYQRTYGWPMVATVVRPAGSRYWSRIAVVGIGDVQLPLHAEGLETSPGGGSGHHPRALILSHRRVPCHALVSSLIDGGSALVSSEARAEPRGVTRLERDFVVEVGGRDVTAATALAALGAVALALLLALAAVLALTATLGRQQGQRAAVGAQHDLGRVAVLARIIGPLAGLHLALDVDLVALGAELLDDVDQGAEHRHAVPLGALALLARLPILPALAGGEGDRRDPRAVAHGADLRVLAEVADQDDLVHGTSHVRNPSEVIRGRAVSLITGVI